jgi:AraC-like DNA-binding protein
MKDFFKYLTIGQESKDWGLFLNVAGKACTLPNMNYPLTDHPSGYYFNFDKGRILNEYQLNYITEGCGIYETTNNTFKVISGSLIIVKKGQWHRYKPDCTTGWTENYIGFDGLIADHFLLQRSVLQQKSIIQIGKHEELIDIYYQIFNLAKEEKPGFQEIASGLLLKLIGHIVAFQKQSDFSSRPLECAIQDLRFDMRNDLQATPALDSYAEKCNVSVDYFRNMFKRYTGLSPHQYHLDLKIIRAKELLLNSSKSIKEISYELGFQSIHYFSRFFKNKVGVNAIEFRNRH